MPTNQRPYEPVMLTLGFVMHGGPVELRVQDPDRRVLFDVRLDRSVLGDLLSARSEVPASLRVIAAQDVHDDEVEALDDALAYALACSNADDPNDGTQLDRDGIAAVVRVRTRLQGRRQ